MKNQLKEYQIPSFSIPELDGHIASNHLQGKSEAQTLGKTDAISFKPPLLCEKFY